MMEQCFSKTPCFPVPDSKHRLLDFLFSRERFVSWVKKEKAWLKVFAERKAGDSRDYIVVSPSWPAAQSRDKLI